MGYYIETSGSKNKAEWIKLNAGGIYLTGRPTHVNPEFVPVVVVDNGDFEAAAIALDEHEAVAFDDKADKRKRSWMLVKKSEVIRLCPKVEKHINW